MQVKSVGRTLSVFEWQTLAWTLVDSSRQCRRSTLSALSLVIQTTTVHPRFLALPCLMASDDENKNFAQQAFEFSIKRLRLSHDILCSKVMALEDQGSDEEAERMRRVAEGNMPECILPYAIHLLSYHPDFPVSLDLNEEGDSRRAGHISNSLKMVINTLLGSARGDAVNSLSYLLKQVEILGTYYCDKLNKDNDGLVLVANLAREILNEKSRAVENVQPYPGEITLPMDLYRHRPKLDGLSQTPPGLGLINTPLNGNTKKAISAIGSIGSGSSKHSIRRDSTPSSTGKPKATKTKKRDRTGTGKENKAEAAPPARKAPTRTSTRIRDAPVGTPPVYEDMSSSDAEMEGWEEAITLEKSMISKSTVRKSDKAIVLAVANENVVTSKKRQSGAALSKKQQASQPAAKRAKVSAGRSSNASHSSADSSAGSEGVRRSARGKASAGSEESAGASIKQYFAVR
jgi:hypothetical protein